MTQDKIFKIYKQALWSGLVILILIVFYRLIVPTGRVEYVWRPGESNEYLDKAKPAERVDLPVDGIQRFVGTPVYLSLRTPRPFRAAEVTVTFESNGINALELGVLKDKRLWRHEIKPLYNQTLEKMISGGEWGMVKKDNLILFQRKEAFKSIDDFLAHPPKAESLAVYNYAWPRPVSLPGYRATTTPSVIKAGLNGPWTAYVYIKDESLSLNLKVSDLNFSAEDDAAVLIVTGPDNRQVGEFKLTDGRGNEESGQRQSAGTLEAKLDGLAEGVYRLEWKAGNDLTIDELTTRQRKLSFAGQLNLENKSQVWLWGSWVSLYAKDASDLRSIAFGNAVIVLNDVYTQYKQEVDCSACQVALPGKITIGSDGRWAFWPDGLLTPSVKTLSPRLMAGGKTDFVLAQYQHPSSVGGDLVATAEFNLADAYREFNKYELMFNLPDWTEGQSFKIKEVRVKLSGLGLIDIWKKLFQR